MTHDELLNEIDAIISIGYAESGFSEYAANGTRAEKALRAVVELHKPVEYATGASTAIGTPAYLPTATACSCSRAFNDYDRVPYPCPTIQAIEKELG
jgi:hypothetical protein